MGWAIETIGVQATAPGTTETAAAAFAGNTLTIRDSARPIWLVELFQRRQTAGLTRVLSPLMHDAVIGLAGRSADGALGHLHRGWARVYPQDTLSVRVTGSGTAGDIEQSFLTVLYEDLPGVSARFVSASELDRRGEDYYCPTATLATGTAGGWSGDETVATDQDQFKANQEYAWTGLTDTGDTRVIRLVGPDIGNLGVAMPQLSQPQGFSARDYWVDMSRALGDLACIPVVNSSNKANTFWSAAVDENGADPSFTARFVRLAPPTIARTRKK